ncbi:hypothetical protein AA106555_0185 [Neokomagataea thailandica NBRC 106555]|uniref:Uncharacterized protein n=1 Tax=Neokomagataea thailandica NBRC 106555 TaxID=1223520 RepID=A0ABQ0QMD8_9PROT|nr:MULTISPECIES: hypothetical protein [Neokomagataea]GBR50366.1 hypothetical protein AA106555_0185 [Neokomagataea thailandica NBRC 106555]
MPSHKTDSGSSDLDPREIKILSDILALVLDEQSGTSEAALAALKLRAARNEFTGGALKNLFMGLTAHPRNTRDEKRIDDLTRRLKNSKAETEQARQRIEALRRALKQCQDEQSLLRQAYAEKNQPYLWQKTTWIIAGVAGIFLGIATAETVHAFNAPLQQPRTLYFR